MLNDAGPTLTILVVEDDEPVAELVRVVLNDVPGWGATVVHDGAAARDVFRHVQVEVLLVDVNLPGMSGLELVRLLRADPHWREPSVILVSANPGQPGLQEVVRQGQVTRFIAKPFDVEQIVAAVHQAAAEYIASR